MSPNDIPEDEVVVEADRRESRSDWIGLLALVGMLCLGFVILVAAGYAARALFRAFV